MVKVLRRLGGSPLVSGIARGFDLLGAFNQQPRYDRTEPAAAKDARAMASDWAVVGHDIAVAARTAAGDGLAGTG